jgi:hypothetical protein
MGGNVRDVIIIPADKRISYAIDFILAACDVEGNFLVVKVSKYLRSFRTRINYRLSSNRHITIPICYLACFLMRESYSAVHVYTASHRVCLSWAIPVCLFFCWVYMRTKYHWTQVLVRNHQSVVISMTESVRIGHPSVCRRAWHASSVRHAHGQELSCTE